MGREKTNELQKEELRLLAERGGLALKGKSAPRTFKNDNRVSAIHAWRYTAMRFKDLYMQKKNN